MAKMPDKIDTSDLRKYKIFLATPCYGGMTTGLYTRSVQDLATVCANHGISLKSYFIFNESLIQRARNYCADEFLRSDATHLLFIDSDIGFRPDNVLTLLALYHSDPETYQIVTGPYPKKTIAWEKVAQAVQSGILQNPHQLEYFAGDYVFNPKKDIKQFNINEPVEVSEAGTGFMLIPRECLVKYKEEYPEYSYKPDHVRTAHFDGTTEITAFFDCSIDPESKRYLSEDYHFCRKSQDIGIKIWMCPWMELTHLGSYAYKASMAALAQIQASPTADGTSNKHKYPTPETPPATPILSATNRAERRRMAKERKMKRNNP